MAGELKIKRSSTPGAVPASLLDGELAINTADKLLFYKDSGGTIQSKSLQAEGGSISDGDKGDIVVSSSGAVWTLEDVFKKSYAHNILNALGSVILAEPPYSCYQITTSTSLFTGQLRLIPVWLSKAATVTGVKWFQVTQGNYTANNYNGVGLYSYSGGTLTLVASSTDDGNIWKGTANSWQSKAFSSTYNATAGVYFIAVLYNNSAVTTNPTVGIATAMQGNNVSSIDLTNGAKISGTVNSLTALPSTQAMSGVGPNTALYYFALY